MRRMHRVALAAMASVGMMCASAAAASDYDVATILTTTPMAKVQQGRIMCASGIRGDMTNNLANAFGEGDLSPVGKECVAYLVRYARQGQFGAPPGLKGNRAPAALALDASFMTAYRQRPAIPQGMPSLATLLPIAERCYRGNEHDGGLCSAAGYALGARLSAGEPLA
jgi:hypothetical protein